MTKEKKCSTTTTPLQELLKLQERRNTVREEAARIRAKISEHEAISEQALASVPTLEDLPQRLEDMRAAVVVGTATQGDLDELKSEIATRRKQIAKNAGEETASEAAATVRGLRRKLTEIEAEVAELDLKHSQGLKAFMDSERHKTEERLLAAMLEVKAIFTQVIAQDSLDDGTLLSSWRLGDFYLPSLPGKAFEGFAGKQFVFKAAVVDKPQAMAAELERLRLLGLDVDALSKQKGGS